MLFTGSITTACWSLVRVPSVQLGLYVIGYKEAKDDQVGYFVLQQILNKFCFTDQKISPSSQVIYRFIKINNKTNLIIHKSIFIHNVLTEFYAA